MEGYQSLFEERGESRLERLGAGLLCRLNWGASCQGCWGTCCVTAGERTARSAQFSFAGRMLREGVCGLLLDCANGICETVRERPVGLDARFRGLPTESPAEVNSSATTVDSSTKSTGSTLVYLSS
jgi:hypothetical protein